MTAQPKQKLEDEIIAYMSEEKKNIELESEKGDESLKCPLCGLDSFVHPGYCELNKYKTIASLIAPGK